MDVESCLKLVGTMGRFQKFVVFTHVMINITYGFQMVFMVIIAATPNPAIPSERNMTTIVTEWNLQNEPWIVDLISSLFMAGFGAGCAVMGQVSDLYGRKKTMLANYTLMHLLSLSCCLAQKWETFAALRTACGFFVGGSGHIVFTLMIENIGKGYWGFVGIIYAPSFAIGMMCLSLLGYLLQDWRVVCLVGSSIPLIMVPIYIIFLPKSSRWLYHVGRIEEAETVLKYIAKKNGRPTANITLSNQNSGDVSGSGNLKKYSMIDMFKRKKLAIYAISSFYLWFACSFVYYGLTLDASLLSPNIFVANTLSGAIECPAYFIAFFTIRAKCIGRKGTLVGCFILSSLSSIGMLFASGLMSGDLSTPQMILGLTNKLAVAAGFSVLYIYTAEVFPTQLRLVALGGSSLFARVGAILSPFVPLLVQVIIYLPYIVYGIFAIFGAVFNLILPETLNKPSPEMDDFLPTNSSKQANNSVRHSDSDENMLLAEDMIDNNQTVA